MKRIALTSALATLALALPALAETNQSSAAARDIVGERLKRFLWQAQSMPNGNVAYLHPLAGDSCVLFVHPPGVSTQPERDVATIGSSIALQLGAGGPTPPRTERRVDGTTVATTTIANSRDEAVDLYMVVTALPPGPGAGSGGGRRGARARGHHVQVFGFHQRPRSICERDPTIPWIMQALGSRPASAKSNPRPDAAPPADAATEADVAAGDPVAPHRAVIKAYLAWARQSGGTSDPSRLDRAAEGLRTLVGSSSGDPQIRALVELGRVQRLRFDSAAAVETLTRAAKAAEARGLREVAFDAWIEVVRAHVDQGQDHGAGAAALERAAEAAGDTPTQKQRFALADEGSRLLGNRGEAEAALVEAVTARWLASTPEDRFPTEFQIGVVLARLAERCRQGHLLQDNLSQDDRDPWDACRRAFIARGAAFGLAAETAQSLGWDGFARIAREQQDGGIQERMLFEFRSGGDVAQRLALRRSIEAARQAAEAGEAWGLRLQTHDWRGMETFAPRSRNDVRAPRRSDDVLGQAAFMRDVTILSSRPEVLALMEKSRAELDVQSGGQNASSFYDRGRLAEAKGDAATSAEMFARAAALLAQERAGFFDPRRRGTVIESRGSIIEALATRLLSLDRDGEAFAAFESARARGLGEMAQVLARSDVGPADRAWLADLLQREARANEIETSIVRDVLAWARFEPPADSLAELDRIRAERRALLRRGEAARASLHRVTYAPAGLAELERAAADAGVPVLLYWTTSTNVIMWHVGPGGTEVRSVLLPQEVLSEKVRRLIASATSAHTPFDETAARELYLFLVAPFEPLLDGGQVMIVPQGPLVGLPFETLIAPESGEPLVQRWAVSYAPNATMALQALSRGVSRIGRLTAVVDPEIDAGTKETEAIAAAPGLQLRVLHSGKAMRGGLAESLAGAEALHLLVHGRFNDNEALLSVLSEHANGGRTMLAAELVALPLRGLRLAVLSACESGRVGRRLSNEIFGFPWALLAGGVEAAVLSRWLVDGASNGAWMRHFYAAVAGGASPAQAAARAMRGMRRDGHAHPHYWAAMQVSGR